jgi:hypothetical protein
MGSPRAPRADRQCGELFYPASEGWIGADHERAYSQLVQGCHDRIEVAFVARVHDMDLQPEGAGRCLISCSHWLPAR